MKMRAALVICILTIVTKVIDAEITTYKDKGELEERLRQRSEVVKRDGILGPLTSIVNAVLALLGIGGALGGGGLIGGLLEGLLGSLGLGGLLGGGGSGGLLGGLLGGGGNTGLLGGLLGGGGNTGLLGGLLGGGGNTGLLGGLLG